MKNTLVLFDIDYTIFDTDVFKASGLKLYSLYPQVKNILNILSNKYTLGVLSQGEKGFQIKKLLETGIYKLFDEDHIFITPDKHGELESIFKNLKIEKTIFVEDKLEILKKAKELNPQMVTIWIKNGPYASTTEETHIPDFSIENISQLPQVFDRLTAGLIETPQEREYN